MSNTEQFHELRPLSAGDPGSDPAGQAAALERLRQAGEQFLQAAGDAIQRALSHDSTAFLAESRQHGGQ